MMHLPPLHILALLFVPLATFAAGWAACVFMGRRGATRSVGAIEQAIAAMRLDVYAQRAETERQRGETDRQRKRADEYFDQIDGCVREATESKQLYQRALAEGAAAQAMLFREIESLSIQYAGLVREYQAATGKLPKRPRPLRSSALAAIAAELGVADPPSPEAALPPIAAPDGSTVPVESSGA